jgi:hypothetical protein
MSEPYEELLRELAVFADLGTQPPKAVESGSDLVVRMSREGEVLELTFHDFGRGKVTERSEDDGYVTHASYRALLASGRFGDIRRWAGNQNDVLARDLDPRGELLPPEGQLTGGRAVRSLEDLDDFLFTAHRSTTDSAQILLIDGPAGIGKTVLIQQLARRRAKNSNVDQRPLLLHVQSRGRVLNNIQDLMAFSLQSLRLRVTYDQVPVLVKRGLVSLAIDGFDELGDPNGYDVAWAQINELVSFIRGQGTLILSGRETFIGRDRFIKDVNTVRRDIDVVDELSLNMPSERTARAWLGRRGWDDTTLSSPAIDALLEEGSYALRPFFLMLLADKSNLVTVEGTSSGYLLQLLTGRIIAREAGKFGDAVDAALSVTERERFIEQFLCEVARDMADNQTEAIEETSLSWLVEASLKPSISPDVINILKNRAGVIAFLAQDERPSFRRFSHAQIQNYFLSRVTIDTISNDEIPKYIRRNILGPEALHVFGEFVSDLAIRSPGAILRFLRGALKAADGYANYDRGARNLGSLLFACLPVSDVLGVMTIRNLDVDDAVIQGSVPPAKIVQVTLNQLDIRGANLECVEFENTQVSSLILDQSSRVPPSFPQPSWVINDLGGDSRVVTEPQAIRSLLDQHGWTPSGISGGHPSLVPPEVREHGIYKLLDKLCRLKQYWIKSAGDERAGRFIASRWWSPLYALLTDHGLVRVDSNIGAGGRSGEFYHIKQPARILAADPDVKDIANFYLDLTAYARQVPDDT